MSHSNARKPDEREIDYLVRLAAKNVCDGVINEPRVFYDTIVLNAGGLESQGSPDVFVNGEEFPVRITHAALALIPDFVGAIGEDERFIQRMGVRFQFHDQYYMSRDFVGAAMWGNKVVSGPVGTTGALSSAVFNRPVILSARDALRVEVVLAEVPPSARTVTVSFTGVGLVSHRPYFLTGSVDLSTTQRTIINPTNYRNDGAEPIALTDVTYHCGGPVDAAQGGGDIRQLGVNIRQIGNGTNANWFQGPTVPVAQPLCSAVLLGRDEGRAIVHRFPGDGLIWEPGEGITVSGMGLTSHVDGFTLGVALHGYLAVV